MLLLTQWLRGQRGAGGPCRGVCRVACAATRVFPCAAHPAWGFGALCSFVGDCPESVICKPPDGVSQPVLLGRSSMELLALPVAYGDAGGVQGHPKLSPLLLPSRLGEAQFCASRGHC